MNITEAYNRAVQQCTPHVFEYAGVLDAFHGIDSLNTSFVESLSIRYGYSGQIPELSDFVELCNATRFQLNRETFSYR